MAQVEVTSDVEVFLDHDVVLDSGMVFPPKGEDGSPWLPAVISPVGVFYQLLSKDLPLILTNFVQ